MKKPENIDIWIIGYHDCDKSVIDLALSYLPEEENKFANQLVNLKVRSERIVTDLSLRGILSRYQNFSYRDWKFVRNKYGKPEAANLSSLEDKVNFNLSHAAGHVAIAVGRSGQLGVDIESETRSETMKNIAEYFMSTEEGDELSRLAGPSHVRRLVSIWTMKEAITKAMGLGLIFPFPKITLKFDNPENPQMTLASIAECEIFLGSKAKWTLMQKHLPSNLSLALAMQHPELSDKIKVTIHEISFKQILSEIQNSEKQAI